MKLKKFLPKEKEGHWCQGQYFDDYEQYNQALKECGKMSIELDVERVREKFIPDVYCDVYPLCVEVFGRTEDGTVYKFQQYSGGKLTQTLADNLDQIIKRKQ